jgi:hypothetical protein
MALKCRRPRSQSSPSGSRKRGPRESRCPRR